MCSTGKSDAVSNALVDHKLEHLYGLLKMAVEPSSLETFVSWFDLHMLYDEPGIDAYGERAQAALRELHRAVLYFQPDEDERAVWPGFTGPDDIGTLAYGAIDALQREEFEASVGVYADRALTCIVDGDFDALQTHADLSQVEHLFMGSRLPGDDGIELIAERTTRLRTLFCGGAGLTDIGAACLASSRAFARLEVLDLTANRLGPEGARAIFGSTTLTSLHTLVLRANSIEDDGVRPLADAHALTGLRRLNLSECGLTDLGAVILAHGYGTDQLESLVLEGASLMNDGEGLEALAQRSPDGSWVPVRTW